MAQRLGIHLQCKEMQEMWVQSLGQEDPLEKEVATHFSTLAWRIHWTEGSCRYKESACNKSDMTEQHARDTVNDLLTITRVKKWN